MNLILDIIFESNIREMYNKTVIGDLAYPEYYFDPVTPKVKVHVQKAAGLLSMFYAVIIYVLFAAD